jgi:single-strand DNA-binding protein
MADLNKVFLMGRLTFDPELRYAPSGSAVTELRLAINRSWTGRDGERKEETLFIDVTVWDRQAETCCQYLKKGSSVHIEGALKMDAWDDKSTGEKRTKVKVQAERVQFLDRRGEGGPPGGTEADYSAAPARDQGPRRASAGGPAEGRGPGNGPARGVGGPPGPGPASRRPAADPDTEQADDDIPF